MYLLISNSFKNYTTIFCLFQQANVIHFRIPDLGNNSTVWSPVSKNPTDPLRLVKITQGQTVESLELSDPGNHTFWATLPLTEFFTTVNLPTDVNRVEL